MFKGAVWPDVFASVCVQFSGCDFSRLCSFCVYSGLVVDYSLSAATCVCVCVCVGGICLRVARVRGRAGARVVISFNIWRRWYDCFANHRRSNIILTKLLMHASSNPLCVACLRSVTVMIGTMHAGRTCLIISCLRGLDLLSCSCMVWTLGTGLSASVVLWTLGEALRKPVKKHHYSGLCMHVVLLGRCNLCCRL